MQEAYFYLKQYFGYDSFRPGQKEIIESILKSRDTLGIMPTGGGKSICFQIPALCMEGLAIVISPLISLMKDQTDGLKLINYPAELMNSTVSQERQREIMSEVEAGHIKLLYLTPERFRSRFFMEWLRDQKIDLFIVDEAHCISEWGHDFRPEYRKMSAIIKELNNPPILAVTATATGEVRDDIVKSLNMNDPFVLVTGFNRTNLVYGVQNHKTKLSKNRSLISFVNKVNPPGIIYTSTVNDAETVFNVLSSNTEKKVGIYHGSLSPDKRKKTQEDFLSDKISVLIATNAFGMGVNKPDVRFVVHYSIPGTLEGFYQETGRAGRDGDLSFCLLMNSYGDEKIQDFFIRSKNLGVEFLEKVLDEIVKLSKKGDVYSDDCDNILKEEKGGRFKIPGAIKQLIHLGLLDTEYMPEERYEVIVKKYKMKNEELYNFKQLFTEGDLKINNEISISVSRAIKRTGTTAVEVEYLLNRLEKWDVISYRKVRKGQRLIVKHKKISNELKKEYSTNLIKRMAIDEKKLEAVLEYTRLSQCRRVYLLNYFGEKFTESNCGKCDICRGTYKPSEDFNINETNKMIMKFFIVNNNQIGLKKGVAILKGLYELEPKLKEFYGYGLLRHQAESYIREEIDSLVACGYLEYKKGQYKVIKVTQEGQNLISNLSIT